MASIMDPANRRSKNLKVHFDLPECEYIPNYEGSVSSISSNSSTASSSPKQCPTTQVMDRTGGYDPNRIPSWVFSTKPEAATTNTTSLNPMEWSATSNESLFSLHINFSKEMNPNYALNKSEGEDKLCGIDESVVSLDTSEEIRGVVMEETSDKVSSETSADEEEEEGESMMVLYTDGSFHFPVMTGEGDGGRNSYNATMKKSEEKQEIITEKPLAPCNVKKPTEPDLGRRDFNFCGCCCFCWLC